MLTVIRTTPYFGSDLQFRNEGVELELNGLSGHGPVVVYASTNLVNWIPIFTNPPFAGDVQFLDSGATKSSISILQNLSNIMDSEPPEQNPPASNHKPS